MARLPKDADSLIRSHETVIKQLEGALLVPDEFRRRSRDQALGMQKSAAHQILRDTPVEELNRGKRGIRVKTLRDAGFSTVLDIVNASYEQLEAISGISPEGASELQRLAADLENQALRSVRIRISADDRSPQATNLILSLTQYQNTRELPREVRKLLRNKKAVTEAIGEIRSVQGMLQWLFAGKARKEAAFRSYAYLQQEKNSGCFEKAGVLEEKLQEAGNLTDGEAWEAFLSRPISYVSLLEELCPGLLGQEDQLCGLPQELADQISGETLDLTGLKCRLRRYQVLGTQYVLHQKKVLLGDEMGLGKTVQAIAAMVSLRNGGATHFLVVCPASVLENWCREIRKHSDLVPVKLHGSTRDRALMEWLRSGGVGVTTYETAVAMDFPRDFRFHMLVVDEAHYIKNSGTQRSVHVRALCRQTDRALLMTGTALENRVEEMISLIAILQPSVAKAARDMISLSAAPRFRETVVPVYYRRKREDVLTELPELIEKDQWCTLGAEERRTYEQAVLAGNFAAARQVSWSAPEASQSSKAQRLLEIAENAEQEGRKLLVFSFFLDTMEKVRQLLGDRCLPGINGSVAPEQRQAIVDQFDASPAGAVLPAQILAGGTGLNIQSASVVVLCEPQLKPSTEHQAVARAYRMGQTRNVLVYRLLCEDTVDERITQLLEQKQTAFDAFADDSLAAQEGLELDSRTLGQLLEQEARKLEQRQKES